MRGAYVEKGPKAHLGRLFHSLRTTFFDVDFRANAMGHKPLG